MVGATRLLLASSSHPRYTNAGLYTMGKAAAATSAGRPLIATASHEVYNLSVARGAMSAASLNDDTACFAG